MRAYYLFGYPFQAVTSTTRRLILVFNAYFTQLLNLFVLCFGRVVLSGRSFFFSPTITPF